MNTFVLSKKSLFAAFALASYAVQAEKLPTKATDPKDNPSTPAKVELGKILFFDPRLSSTGTVSCNSCHNMALAGVDGTPTSTGIEGKVGGRNSPTVLNAAFHSVQFWDGRAATLEDQAKGPLTNPIEMGMPDHNAVMDRIKSIKGYPELFAKAFPKDKDPLTIDHFAKAVAAFERTLITPNSPYDKFVGGDKKALSAAAQRGLKKVEEVGCQTCHMGPNFNGPADLEVGLGFYQKFPTYPDNEFTKKYKFQKDLGRFEVTKDENDKNMWRVPTWRNVALTAPYFHNGSVQSLEEAVRIMGKTQLNIDLAEADVKDIVAFLESLTGPQPKVTLPVLPQ